MNASRLRQTASGCALLMVTVTAGVAPAMAQQQAVIEEIIVTGSLIRRDSFDSASPLTVIDQSMIADNATPNLGEVLVNQTFNYGSDFQTNTFAARPQNGTTTAANLRGLGTAATLNLIDGRRASPNLNNSIPQIAIDRIEILKDGASAIYGTDAVAGVVNIITRKNFSGSQFSAFYQEDDGGDLREQQYEFLAGADTANGHITMALGYKTRGTLRHLDRPEYTREGFQRSDTGNPGTWRVPTRDEDGNITGARVLRDPGCGTATAQSPGGSDIGQQANFLSGDRRDTVEFALDLPAGIRGGQACAMHFGEFWNYINPNDQVSAWINFEHQFSNNLTNELDFQFAQLRADSRGSPQNPGGRTEEFPTVLGDHPGNPFRALNANGEPLFAVDDGSGRAARDADGNVILSASPTDPASGVPFNEDVDVVQLRIFGKLGLLPGANQPTSLNDDGANTGNATFDTTTYRLVNKLSYDVPDSSWIVDLTGQFSRTQTVLEAKNSSQNALVAGLRGELIAAPASDPAGAAGPTYWNPFSTQALNCEDRVCAHTGTPDFANSLAVLDAINIQTHNFTETDFWVANLIATGDLFEMPSGMLQGAFGLEYRKTSIDTDIDSARNQCDWHEGGCGFDWRASQTVNAAFLELAVPVLNNLDLTIAGRYEDYGGGIGDSFDPKLAFLWQPMDMLSIRGSWSSAFVAPTLTQQFESENCGLETMQDELTGDFSGTFRVACVTGNRDLKPETADVFNIGASLNLLNGDLSLGVDYAVYDFEDRISQETGNNVLRANFASFVAAGNDPNNPADVDAWIANNEPRIFRDPTGFVARVLVDRVNAQEMKHKAWDFYARYNLPWQNLGNFTVSANATLVDEFSFDLGTGDPADRGDGVGKQNEQVAEVPPLPEWRINGTVNWFYRNHSASVRVRWIDGFDLQFNSAGLQNLHGLRGGKPSVDDITYVDVNYKYTFDNLIGDRSTTVEVGANNLFDEFPDPFFNLGGIETFVHDVRGRMVYLRLNTDL
ncbi:MAG: TonB-dependent receptor plug domain-containing protein [Pseudomonadales bacterium]